VSDTSWFWIYMIECDNGSYYTGYTNNLARRFRQHLDGTANVKYTRSYKPVRLAQCWRLFDTVGTALKVESFIKRGGSAAKRRILDDPRALTALVAARLDRTVDIAPFDAAAVEAVARALSPDDMKSGVDPFGPTPLSNS
jgi:putative endonuclease